MNFNKSGKLSEISNSESKMISSNKVWWQYVNLTEYCTEYHRNNFRQLRLKKKTKPILRLATIPNRHDIHMQITNNTLVAQMNWHVNKHTCIN